jgi:hypothetical protein
MDSLRLDSPDVERFLNQLVGRTALVWQLADKSGQLLNVLSLNGLGLLVQDAEYEYFVPWASVRHVRLATEVERKQIGSPAPRTRRQRTVLK